MGALTVGAQTAEIQTAGIQTAGIQTVVGLCEPEPPQSASQRPTTS